MNPKVNEFGNVPNGCLSASYETHSQNPDSLFCGRPELLNLAIVPRGVDTLSLRPDEQNALHLAHRALLSDQASRYYSRLTEIFQQICQSPSERILLSALILSAVVRSYEVVVKHPLAGCKVLGEPWSVEVDRLTITPQAEIGEFHPDFLIECRRQHCKDNAPEAEERYTFRDIEAKLVVECDGHEYHDRTKEQASADRARDRILQSCGFKVFRFTGSDITRDAVKCSEEILVELEKATTSIDPAFEPLIQVRPVKDLEPMS